MGSVTRASPVQANVLFGRSCLPRRGQVTVRCTGRTIQLRIAQPYDGWRVEVGKAGPDEVQVIFRHGEDDGEGGTQVTALCVAGTPVFKVESQG
jgi:hypothetical protein